MELTGAASAGLSIYESSIDAPGVFRWRHLRGQLAPFEDATTPRDDSPCGVTLDRNGPVLARHPERIYDWIAAENLVIPEVLLVPLNVGEEEPLGTLWIVADEGGHFRKEDAELAIELARFVAIALRFAVSEEQLRNSLRQQELLAREMGHRVKNVFALTESIVRVTAGRAESAADFAQSLSRRLSALSSAHGLARGISGEDSDVELAQLVRVILAPFDLRGARFRVSGPQVRCGPNSAGALALVFHELATNAAKYGALSHPSGEVEVEWSVEADRLELIWSESGGPEIVTAPKESGFGSTLIRRTVTRQFAGELDESWGSEGCVAEWSCRWRSWSTDAQLDFRTARP